MPQAWAQPHILHLAHHDLILRILPRQMLVQQMQSVQVIYATASRRCDAKHATPNFAIIPARASTKVFPDRVKGNDFQWKAANEGSLIADIFV